MKKQKRIVIILTVVVLVLAAAVTALLLYQGRGGKSYERQMELGKKHLEAEEYEEALACFRKAMEIEPKKEEPYVCMADIYEVQGRFDKMAEILRLGCERAKAAMLEEQYERLAERLAEAEKLAEEAGQDPGGEETGQPEGTESTENKISDAPEPLTADELFHVSQNIEVLLDWKINEDDISEGDYKNWPNHNAENLMEEAVVPGKRVDFLIRCFKNMEILYPGKITDQAGNYSQMGRYFEEWGWTPVSERPDYGFTDWSAALDLFWIDPVEGLYEGARYYVKEAFVLEEFNQMLAEVFDGAVPPVTEKEISGYFRCSERFFEPLFLYDSVHGTVCRIYADWSTGGDWELENMYHNYITGAERIGDVITAEIQKLSINSSEISRSYSDIAPWNISKEEYKKRGMGVYEGVCGQILAIDGRSLNPLRPIHSYMEEEWAPPYEDIDGIEDIQGAWEAVGRGGMAYTEQEVFERLQANSAALLKDPDVYGPGLTVGNRYRAVFKDMGGWYRVLEITGIEGGGDAQKPEESTGTLGSAVPALPVVGVYRNPENGMDTLTIYEVREDRTVVFDLAKNQTKRELPT